MQEPVIQENEFGIKSSYDIIGKDSDEQVHNIAKKEYVEFQKDMFKGDWDKMYKDYDKIYDAIGWPSPAFIATLIDGIGLPKDAWILDIGVGSGLVGKELTERGYSNLDGCDGCQGFLDMSKEKGYYKDLYHSFVTSVEDYPYEQRVGKYDVVVSVGVMLRGNMPKCIFEIKDRLCKVGGYISFSCGKQHWEEFEFGPACMKLVKEGRWELVKQEETLKY